MRFFFVRNTFSVFIPDRKVYIILIINYFLLAEQKKKKTRRVFWSMAKIAWSFTSGSHGLNLFIFEKKIFISWWDPIHLVYRHIVKITVGSLKEGHLCGKLHMKEAKNFDFNNSHSYFKLYEVYFDILSKNYCHKINVI